MAAAASFFYTAWMLLFMQSSTHAFSSLRGSVYCDQCLVGHHSIWSIPLQGVKVSLDCKGSGGHSTLSQQGQTNLFGQYSMKVDASMQECSISLLSSPSKSCNIAGVSHGNVSLSWKLFGMAFYTADSLSYKPPKPKSFCPNATSHAMPTISFPPLPFAKLSACPPNYWVDPKYKCYWRLISPDTKVSIFYGQAAAKKYGADTTLWDGLHGGGDIHKVLLREAVAASLNAFNSVKFYYNGISVAIHFNQALEGSDKDVIRWALAFRRANSGYGGKAKCLMTPCK